jgi:hypothetical protein
MIIHLLIIIGGGAFALAAFLFLMHHASRSGCDHTFPKNNAMNPKCEKCGKGLMELIQEWRSKK